MANTPRPTRNAIVAAAILAIGAVAYLSLSGGPPPTVPADTAADDPPPPDPRLTFATVFRNVKPGVQFTGDASCAGCHAGHAASYHRHPMGRSADRIGRPGAPENYSSNNPFAVGGYTLRSEKTPAGDRHVVSSQDGIGKPLPDSVMLATVAIGSGTRGRSYLAVEGGAVFQTPVSWFGGSMSKWDLSPSFDLGGGGRRTISKDCLYCHVNGVDAVEGSVNRISPSGFPEQLNVGCERCHGPGELHVRERANGMNPIDVDTSIVNPKHLSRELRGGICQQCHLQGEERIARRGRDLFEYRPGLPWEQFASVFVRHPNIADYRNSVGQFEQMHASKCFSGGKLDCTGCHDPHAKPEPAMAAAHYRTRCLACHETKGCVAPAVERAARADSCTACHMPKSESANIVHAAVTDHRIRRRASDATAGIKGLPPDADPIVPFSPSRFAPPAEERERDLALGYARAIGKMQRPVGGRSIATVTAEGRLLKTLERWPGDAPAWDALGQLRGRGDSPDLALDAARRAAALEPGSELRLAALATALAVARKNEEALAAIDRLVKLNPRLVDYRILRAAVHLNGGEWAEAEAACREGLAIHPQHPSVHLDLALCRFRQGDAAGGKAELETAIALTTNPVRKAELRKWYERRTR